VLISIIVPVLNEAPIIRGLLEQLRLVAPGAEIIVVDGGSSDGTPTLCHEVADHILQTHRGRAWQMNAGAKIARGDILWFVHADSRVAPNSAAAIEKSLNDPLVAGGCFRLQIIPPRRGCSRCFLSLAIDFVIPGPEHSDRRFAGVPSPGKTLHPL